MESKLPSAYLIDGGTEKADSSFPSKATHTPECPRSSPLVHDKAGQTDETLTGGSSYGLLQVKPQGLEKLVAVNLGEYERYQRARYHRYFPQTEEKKKDIAPGPLETSFSALAPPEGWRSYVHPEGVRYFFRDDPEERTCPTLQPVAVLTEAWIYKPGEENAIQDAMEQLFKYMAKGNLSFRQRRHGGSDQGHFGRNQHRNPVVLVLELRLTGNIGYYFVDHRKQRLFWLETFDFSFDISEVNIDHTDAHVGLKMRSQYWTHNEFFPDFYELTEVDLTEIDNLLGFALGGMLAYIIERPVLSDITGTDLITSNSSAITLFTADQLKYCQETLYRYDGKVASRRIQSTGDAIILYRERFLNLHGEWGARLDASQSIHYSRDGCVDVMASPWHQRLFSLLQRPLRRNGGIETGSSASSSAFSLSAEVVESSSIGMKALALCMFGGPAVHCGRLRDITRDGLINRSESVKYALSMVAEWRDVALYSTVLLGVNVSFLAIQSIDEKGSQGPWRTPSQRASYFSVVASMGSIASSLFLLTFVRHQEMNESVLYNYQIHASRWVLENHALTYAMPLSLAIWSLLSFFVSFGILWWDSVDYIVIRVHLLCQTESVQGTV
ncbi:hypothetical protein NMY22_g11662 [Coprinellus aureogranulatus]|nr:hypothetical protein NMY22_g11662 [Coprinellus aureogranulatus]